MKKLLILSLVVCSFVSFGQTNSFEVSASGRKYIKDFKDTSKVTIIYLHGSGQLGTDLNLIKQTPFYKLFYAAYGADYNFFMPQQTKAFSGWENTTFGHPSGAYFVREMIAQYGITKIIVTGHSAGAAWKTATNLQTLIGGFAPVAGRSLDFTATKLMGTNQIPVNAWHGDKDTAAPNNYTAGKQAVSWYKQGGGTNILFNVLVGVGHGSDSYAYKPTSGLKGWIDMIYPVVEVHTTGIFIDGVWQGDTECDFQGLHIEYRN